MIDIVDAIKQIFPSGIYDSPCSEMEIKEAEELLGQKLPDVLRHIYLNFNGFWIQGRAIAIHPLLPRHANTSTVSMTLFWKNDPYMPVKENIVFFGISSKHHSLGIQITQPEVIVEYSPDLGEPQEVGKTILDAFKADEEWFRSLHLPPSGQPSNL